MKKPRVVVINPDDTMGKFMTGEAFVDTYFPELLVDRPGPAPIDPTPEPPIAKPTPSVASLPRTYLGSQTTTGNPMYLIRFPDAPRLVEDHSGGKLEKVSVCGFEIGMKLAPGAARPSGPFTQGWGFNTPADFVCPDDYAIGYFPGNPGRQFFVWKRYVEPDPVTPIQAGPIPAGPAPTSKPPVVTPDPVPTDPILVDAGAVIETGTALYQGQPINYIVQTNG